MRFIHQITVNIDAEVSDQFSALGIELSPGLTSFEIDESDPVWLTVCGLVARHKALDVVRTEFTQQEVRDAKALAVSSSWHHGYPQPERGHGYRTITYDTSDYCPTCGIGLRQTAPFRMKTDPRWGAHQILQLNWIFDEFFVTPEAWRDVFRPHGVPARPVLDAKGQELQTVVQLQVDALASAALGDRPRSECRACGRAKFEPAVRGFFPHVEIETHMAKTEQHFGSGARAWRQVIMSSDLHRSIQAAGITGIEITPVAHASSSVP